MTGPWGKLCCHLQTSLMQRLCILLTLCWPTGGSATAVLLCINVFRDLQDAVVDGAGGPGGEPGGAAAAPPPRTRRTLRLCGPPHGCLLVLTHGCSL
jgi:hypothetical protein